MKHLNSIIESIQKSLSQIKIAKVKKVQVQNSLQIVQKNIDQHMILVQKMQEKQEFYEKHQDLDPQKLQELIRNKIKICQDKNLELNLIEVENNQAIDNLQQNIEDSLMKKQEIEDFLENLDIQNLSDPNLIEMEKKYYEELKEKKEQQNILDELMSQHNNQQEQLNEHNMQKQKLTEQEQELKEAIKQDQDLLLQEEKNQKDYEIILEQGSIELNKIMNQIQKLIDKKRKNDPRSSLWKKNNYQDLSNHQGMMDNLINQNSSQKNYNEQLLENIESLKNGILSAQNDINKIQIKEKIKQKIQNLANQKKVDM